MSITLTNEQIDYIVIEDLFLQYQNALEDGDEHAAYCILETLKYYEAIRESEDE